MIRLSETVPYGCLSYDDVTKWNHFPLYWPFVLGIGLCDQWRGALMFSLICAWINSWVNKREAGDWRRHRAHHDVTVIHLWLWYENILAAFDNRPKQFIFSNNERPYAVYPKKYAHGFVVLCFVVVMQSFIMNSHEVFIHIHQGCFAGTGAIVRLPQCQWSKPDGYGKISQCITTTKHSKAKTVCIFLGIYCSLW